MQRTRRGVLVKVAVKVDFVTDDAHLAVFVIAFAGVDPGIRHMRQDFALKIGVDVFPKRHIFIIAQIGVGFRLAVFVGADVGVFRGFAPLPLS